MKNKTKNKYNTGVFPTSGPLENERKLLHFSYADNEEERGVILRIKEIIDKTTDTLFVSYENELLSQPITYIISAVWGKTRHRTLTGSQKKIYEKIDDMIIEIMETLEFDDLNETQKFAVEYLIRGLVISKIAYLIEAFKNNSLDEINKGKSQK